MYEKPEGLWGYGTWVNGGHWSTCEARMVLAYYRLGKFEDARRSMRQLLTFAERFRMDNPLTKCGSDVYQPNQPINLCYDTFGPAAAFMRGLFEYLYRADGLTLVPHVPPGHHRAGADSTLCASATSGFCLSTIGAGPITAVRVNGRKWKQFDRATVFLPYDKTPDLATVQITLGTVKPAAKETKRAKPAAASPEISSAAAAPDLSSLEKRAAKLRDFQRHLAAEGLGSTYAAAHAQLATECVATAALRLQLIEQGKIKPLPPPSETAADKAYAQTATKLCDGLDAVLKSYEKSNDSQQHRIWQAWLAATPR